MLGKEAYTNDGKYAKIVFGATKDSVSVTSPYIGSVADFNDIDFDFTTAYLLLKEYLESKGLTVVTE